MVDQYTIGLDVGGSKTIGVIFKKNSAVSTLREKTPKQDIVSFLSNFIKKLKDDYNIQSIGLALPGALNEKRTEVLFSGNLRAIEKINLKKTLEKEFKVQVLLENDANCFTWGEFLHGAGEPFKTIVGITLGTGLGSGLVIDKKLYIGSFGAAPELGHNILRAGGIKCNCGNKGCFEQYASSQFFLKQTGKNPRTLYRKAKEGDEKALKIWEIYGDWVGQGLAQIANIIDPEAIIVGGGISQAWEYFHEKTEKSLRKAIFSPVTAEKAKLLKTSLGQKAGAIGAAELRLK